MKCLAPRILLALSDNPVASAGMYSSKVNWQSQLIFISCLSFHKTANVGDISSVTVMFWNLTWNEQVAGCQYSKVTRH